MRAPGHTPWSTVLGQRQTRYTALAATLTIAAATLVADRPTPEPAPATTVVITLTPPQADVHQLAQLLTERLAYARRPSRATRTPAPPAALAHPKAQTRQAKPRPQPKPKPPRPSRVEIVVRYALAQIGDPYVFGAVGPNAWDCSGLVVGAYRQIGISLPHYTGSLLHHGWRISRAQLRRGDLIFPSHDHVGIYLGNGRMIVAPHTGARVRIETVYAFYTARRILT